jgi:hypothetical protein
MKDAIRSAKSGVAAALIVCTSSGTALTQSMMTIATKDMQLGAAPEGFELARTGQGAPAQWIVAGDPAPAGGKAIEQTSTDVTAYRFPLAIYKAASAKDVDVRLRFKTVSGKVDQAAGIALRLRDADNYYVVRANALENNVRFYRVVKGKREELKSEKLKVAPATWHTLGLRAEGSRFTVTFNDKTLYSATDTTFADAGRVALWTKADSVTRFDQITIRPLP